jgi:hypothetical protein
MMRPPAAASCAEGVVVGLCSEFGVKIVDKHRYPMPGETRALVTIERIIRRHGLAHTRLVMSTLAETEGGNSGLIDETSLWAVSDLVRACEAWIEADTSRWLFAWDALPMGAYMYPVQGLRGVSHQRHALAGLCYVFLCTWFGPNAELARKVIPQPSRGIHLTFDCR